MAVSVSVEWYREGADVQARMPLLSTYLGHVDPAGTYWYLSAAPELLHLVAARLDAGVAQCRPSGLAHRPENDKEVLTEKRGRLTLCCPVFTPHTPHGGPH